MLRRLLSADVKLWHLLVVVAVLALSTNTALAARNTAPTAPGSDLSSDAFLPTGVFNMATTQSNTSKTVHSADGEVEVLRAEFIVPAGHSADIAAFFNAEAYKYPNGYCYLTFNLDQIGSGVMKPGELWVADGYVYTGAYPTLSAQGFKKNVPAGHHTLLVALHATGGDCFVDDRSLIVISNRHS